MFEGLGRDKKLPLSGRPPRPFGALNTSKVFRVFGDTVLCYPLLFEVRDFYMSADPSVLIEDIKVSDCNRPVRGECNRARSDSWRNDGNWRDGRCSASC